MEARLSLYSFFLSLLSRMRFFFDNFSSDVLFFYSRHFESKKGFFLFRRTFFEKKVSIFETFRNGRTVQFSMDVRGKLGYSCETLA